MPASARSPKQPTHGPFGGTAAPPDDISSTMPRTMRDDLTGDFLGLGYDQRMRAENDKLNIYDPPSRGGALLQSTPLDLAPFPEKGVSNGTTWDGYPVILYTWAEYGHDSSMACQNCFSGLWDCYHLNTIYLARNNVALAPGGDALFIAGTTGNSFKDGTPYHNVLYQLPPDGSCGHSYASPESSEEGGKRAFPISVAADAARRKRTITHRRRGSRQDGGSGSLGQSGEPHSCTGLLNKRLITKRRGCA